MRRQGNRRLEAREKGCRREEALDRTDPTLYGEIQRGRTQSV